MCFCSVYYLPVGFLNFLESSLTSFPVFSFRLFNSVVLLQGVMLSGTSFSSSNSSFFFFFIKKALKSVLPFILIENRLELFFS